MKPRLTQDGIALEQNKIKAEQSQIYKLKGQCNKKQNEMYPIKL